MLTYDELSQTMNLARSNGRLSELPRGAKALLYAALKYTKSGNIIKSPYVLKQLQPIIEFLKKDSNNSQTGTDGEASVKNRQGGHPYDQHLSPDSLAIREQIFDVLNKLRRRPDARRRVRPLTRGFLELVMKAPVKLSNQKLLSIIVKALKEVKESLSPALRLFKQGMAEAWRASMTAYKWGNENALEWRRDKAFAIYWGAMVHNWPKAFKAPATA